MENKFLNLPYMKENRKSRKMTENPGTSKGQKTKRKGKTEVS